MACKIALRRLRGDANRGWRYRRRGGCRFDFGEKDGDYQYETCETGDKNRRQDRNGTRRAKLESAGGGVRDHGGGRRDRVGRLDGLGVPGTVSFVFYLEVAVH